MNKHWMNISIDFSTFFSLQKKISAMPLVVIEET